MGSKCVGGTPAMRKTLQLKAKKPEVGNLQILSKMVNKIQCQTFANRYGNILYLLEVDVQVEAITALAQYYDPPLRCFTFRDFQLAPTLEEFEQMLGHPLKEGRPYRYLGHYPSTHTITKMLKVPEKEVQSKKQTRGKTEGFPKKYLEERIHLLVEDGDWDAYMDVLALTIYGIVIFPNADDFVDLVSIDIFLAQKSRDAAVKRLEVIKNGPKLWQISLKEQFGGIHDGGKYKSMDPIQTEELRRVRQAWDNIIRKSKELGVRSCGTTESYRQWVRNRAMEVKLPFFVTIPVDEETSVPIPTDNEELKEVKVKLTRVEEEKKELEVQLREVRQAYEALQLENTEKSRSLEKANKRARADREQANKTMRCWELLGNSKITKREVKKELDNMKQQMQEMVVDYERKIEKENLVTREMVEKYQDIIKKKHEDIQGLLGQQKEKYDVVYQSKREMVFWATRFSNLVWIANGAVEDVPRLLKMANAMINPLTTPEEICNFIEHCKSPMRQMKQWMDCNN
ncbi:hypothetical protein SESBI_29287 [Sesbania bispinosa]|nr:hypothetical protein SESBI_29287 [Sesbania bispinosa]